MTLILPPGLSERQFNKALSAFTKVIGAEWVLDTDEDRDVYTDLYSMGQPELHLPSVAISPANSEELQAIVKIANEYKVPLWPISRGKNFGYGTNSPRMPGTVVLDLGRMRRIIEVNVERGYCLLEPGVGFYDLYEYLEKNDIPLWISPAANGWGSVVGNALEHGFGYTPYGDNADQICGMEVVLANGELVRTGMGAQNNSECWQLFKYGYGPRWDHMFTQSNFGIVSKMGLWLMPTPEAVTTMKVELPEEDDIGWAIDALAPLRLQGILQNPTSIANYMRVAMVATQRKDWYDGEGAMPEEISKEIRKKFNLGWWGTSLKLFGYPEVNEFNAGLVKKAFAKYSDVEFEESLWVRGEPRPFSEKMGVPISFPLQMSNWAGPNGAHGEFSPVLPSNGDQLLAQHRRVRKLFNDFGIDYYGSLTLGSRHINNINVTVYDKTDVDQTTRVRGLIEAMIKMSADHGIGGYRTHLTFMDDVAKTFDFNNNALLKLNETVKDALDPNGILAPGKQGIWPKAYRGERS